MQFDYGYISPYFVIDCENCKVIDVNEIFLLLFVVLPLVIAPCNEKRMDRNHV